MAELDIAKSFIFYMIVHPILSPWLIPIHRHPREGGDPLLAMDSRLRGNDGGSIGTGFNAYLH